MNTKKLSYLLIIALIVIVFVNNSKIEFLVLNASILFIKKVFGYLFLMMVLNNTLINIGFINHFKNKYLYLIIMSILSGSPSNAIILKSMRDNNIIEKKDVDILLPLTSFPSILFMFNTLKSILNIKTAVILILILYILNILLLVINKKKINFNKTIKAKENDFLKSFLEAIKTSISTMLNIYAIFIFFKIISDLICPFNNIYYSLLKGLIEISQGLLSISNITTSFIKKEIISYILIAFGSFSVHMQINAIIENINIKSFYKYKFLTIIFGILLLLIIH